MSITDFLFEFVLGLFAGGFFVWSWGSDSNIVKRIIGALVAVLIFITGFSEVSVVDWEKYAGLLFLIIFLVFSALLFDLEKELEKNRKKIAEILDENKL